MNKQKNVQHLSYQKHHDITDHIGQTAGIDPKSGRIWFGDSALEIVKKRETEGLISPLFFQRVGYEAYFRKGRRKNEAFWHPRARASIGKLRRPTH